MIDQPTIERILDAANIIDVVSDFVTLRKRGVNYVGLCPFHSDKTPSFYVSPAKNICKCFACGEGGTSVHFIMKHEQLNYFDALRLLAKKYNIEIQERELTDKEKERQSNRESMLIVNSWAQKYFADQLHKHEEGKRIGYSYFVQRGFRDDIIKKFQLGYSLDKRDALYQEATRKGYKKEFLEKTGLIIPYENGNVNDRFRGRVMFPVHGLSGKVVAFGGRTLKKDEKTAKYVNSPESEIYHKSNELYGIYFAKQAIVKADQCFLVEGYTDVISMHQAGIENVVASSGTALTIQQIRLIHRFTNNITVLYDGDAAGIKAALRGIDLILEEGMNIKVVLLPDGEDPDSFARKNNATAFAEFIKKNETDFIRFKTQLLLDDAGNDPIKRSALISDIIKTVAIIPDNIARTLYIRECSRMMEIEEKVVLNEVNKILLNNLEKTPQPRREPVVPETVQETSPVQVSATAQSSPQEETVLEKPSIFHEYELALLRYVVRYSGITLFKYIDPDTGELIILKVVEYIQQELSSDNISFSLSIYRQIIEEALEKEKIEKEKELLFEQQKKEAIQKGEKTDDKEYQPQFNSQRYFLSHPDTRISQFAANLISEKYQLSKYHTKYRDLELEEQKLQSYVVKDIFTFKGAFIQHHINRTKILLKEAQEKKEEEKMIELMKRQHELQTIQMHLSKENGERIILKM